MSASGKIAVVASLLFTTSIITYVFYTQELEKERMKKGVREYLKEKQTTTGEATNQDTNMNSKNDR